MSAWHEEARRLRSEGWKLIDIARRFHVTRSRASTVCKGIQCPVDHQAAVAEAGRVRFSNPEWRQQNWRPNPPVARNETADFLRAHYLQDMTAAQIADRLGITRNAVIGRARDMGLGRKVSTAHKNSEVA